MTENIERDPITPLVSRYFDIEQLVHGGGQYPYAMRYRGKLRSDSIKAHAALTKALRPLNYTPLFLEEGKDQIVQIIPALPKPTVSNPWINLIFFLLTAFSMLLTGALYAYQGPQPDTLSATLRLMLSNLPLGLPFAASMLAILLAHEFGHYLAARYHNTAVTLPYFLPFPGSLLGTLGAFIQLKEPPRNKRVLLDIGLAGPLAGLIVAVPVLLLGLSLSHLDQFPAFIRAGDGIGLEGNSILYLFSKFLVFGQWLPTPTSFNGVEPFMYWLRYIFTGLPTPLGGTDVILHPIAWAGWAGLLVTALNLIPAGQLDGGHTIYALFGKRAERAVPIVLVSLAALGFYWNSWWLWVALILFLGRGHAQPLDQITKLDTPRKILAVIGLLIFILIFIPIPFRQIIGPYGGP